MKCYDYLKETITFSNFSKYERKMLKNEQTPNLQLFLWLSGKICHPAKQLLL